MAKADVVLTAGLDVTEFNKGLNAYIKGLNRMQSETAKAATEVSSLGNAASTGIGVAMGVAAVQGITTFTRAMTGLGKEVLGILKFFESLQFSLETTIALNMATADESLSMADALTQTGDAAESYLLTLQDLAIFSPFTTEEIASGNRTLQIYGLMADEALGLTRLIVDLASVGGFGAERLQRISLATGQIFAEGRLLARDALQLTQAGVPILKFIENMTGQTTGQIQKLMRKGLLPANVAFEALVDGLKDFEGAGRRVAGTAQGLVSSLEDLRQLTLLNIFKGVFEGIRPFMQDLVDIFSAQEMRANFVAVGDVLGAQVQRGISIASKAIGIFINTLRGLPKEAVAAIAVFAGAAAALAAFGAAIGLVQFALIALINPFTVVVAAFAGFAALFVAGQQKIGAGAVDMNEKVTSNTIHMARVFGSFTNVPLKAVENITKFSDAFGNAGAFIIRIFGEIERSAADATNFILDLLSSVADWGASVGQLFASGIASASNLVGGALGVIGSVVGGLLAPGSPPKLLPDIDTWGRLAAEEWLKGWAEADFSILNDITSAVRDQLRSLVSAKDLDEVSAARILIGSKQDIADAINQIAEIGSVTQKTMDRVRRSAGPAADQVEALLRAYEDVSFASRAAADAQDRLNQVTAEYESALEPLRKELERISELRRQGDEDAEVRNLQRIIANAAIGSNRKRQAQLRIQEILLGRQVRGLEKEKEEVVDGAQAKLDAAQKAQEAAQLALSLTQERIKVQTQQIALYGEELKALEKLARELEKLRKKLRDEFLKPFEDAIKKASLLAAEVKDTIALFKARHEIASAESTEAEKIAAAIALQSIEARRSKRFFELRELGVSQDEIDRLREFAVTLADIGIKGTGEDIFGDVDLSGIAEDTGDRIKEFRDQVAAFKESMDNAREGFQNWLATIDAVLPPYLKFITTSETAAPLFKNIGAAFAGIVAIIASNRFIGVLRALPGLILGVGTPFGLIINAIGLFTAAWIADWGGIRQFTADSLQFIQVTFDNFINRGGFNSLIPDDEAFVEKLGIIESAWSEFSSVLTRTFQEGLSVEGLGDVVGALGETIRTTINTLFDQDLFAAIRKQIDDFIDFVSSPTRLAAAFGKFFDVIRSEINTVFQRLMGDNTAGRALTEYIQDSILGSAGAFVANIPIWIGQFLGAVSDFLNNIRPQLSGMFDDFFGKVIPTLLFLFGRTAGAIGSGIGELVLTALNILFTEALPALFRNLPRIFGALATGFATGAREAGNSLIDALTVMTAGILAFISVTLGPSVLRALQFAFKRAFQLAGKQVGRDIGKIVGSIKLALTGLGRITGTLLLAIGGDLVNIIGSALRVLLGGLGTAGQKILAFFGAPLRSVLTGTLTLFFTGLQTILGGISDILTPTFNWQTAIANVGTKFQGVVTIVGNLPGKISAVVTAFGGRLFNAATVAATALEKVFEVFGRILRFIPRIFTGLSGLFELGFRLAESFRSAFTIILESGTKLIPFFGTILFNIFNTIGTAITTALGSIGDIGGGLRRVLGGVLTFLDNLSFNSLATQITTIFNQLKGFGAKGVSALGTAFSSLGTIIGRSLGAVQPLIQGFFTNLSKIASSGFVKTISAQFVNLGKTGFSALQKLGPRISQLTALAPGGGFLSRGPAAAAQQAVSGIGGLLRGGAGGATNAVTGVFNAIKNANIVKQVTSLSNLGRVLGGLKSIFLGFLSPLTLVTSAIDFFAFAFNAEVDGVENRAQNFIGTLRQLWDDLISGKLWQDIISTAQTFIGGFLEIIGLITEFGFDSEEVQTRLAEIGQGMLDWIADLGNRIWESIREFWIPFFVDWITETITNLVETLGTIAAAIITWIGEVAAPAIGEQLKTWIQAFTTWWTEGGGDEKTVETLNNILSTIGGWITTGVGFIAEKLAVWIPAFIDWLFEVIPPLLVALGGIILTIGAWIIEQIPVLVNKLLEWGAAFLDWLGPVTVKVIGGLGDWLASILTWIIGTAIPGIIKGAIGLVGALINWISGKGEGTAEGEAPSKLTLFLTSLKNFFTQSLIPALFTLGAKLVQALWDGFKELWDALGGNELLTAINDWIEGIRGTIDDWIQLGKDLIIQFFEGVVLAIFAGIDTMKQSLVELLNAIGAPDFIIEWVEKGALMAKEFIFGIADGIVEWMFHPIAKLKEGLTNLVNDAKTFLKIDSPSKLMASEIGVPIAEGIGEGIKSVDTDDALKDFKLGVIGNIQDANTVASREVAGMSTNLQRTLNDLNKKSTRTVKDNTDDILESWVAMSDDTQELMIELEEFLSEIFDRTTVAMVADVEDMSDTLVPLFNGLRTDIDLEMNGLSSAVITEFTQMKDDSIIEAGLMIDALIGMFITDDDSLVKTLTRFLIGDETGTGATQGLGLDFVAGIAQGITSPTSYLRLFNAMKQIIDDTISAIRLNYEMNSPSEVAARLIGEPIVEGIIAGMLRTAPEFTKILDAITLKETGRLERLNQAFVPQPSRNDFSNPGNLNQNTRNYNLSVNASGVESQGIIRDFSTMEALG